MFKKSIYTALILLTGLCYGQSWREKPLSRATFLRNSIKHIQIIAKLKKMIITYPLQLKGINFDPERFSLSENSSFYNAATSWEERDFENSEIITSHALDSSKTCPITVNEDNLLNLLMEFRVLRIGRSPAHINFTPPDSFETLFLTFVYDSVSVTSFLEKFSALPYVLDVNVPIMSDNISPDSAEPKPHGCLENTITNDYCLARIIRNGE